MSDQAQPVRGKVSTGIGCAMVFPVALFGTLMIADYPGPPGPIGFVEFFGWWAVCLAVAYFAGWLLLQFRQRKTNRGPFLVSALAMPVILGLLTWLDIQPSTPAHVKRFVEYALQVVGVAALAAAVALMVWIARSSRRSRKQL